MRDICQVHNHMIDDILAWQDLSIHARAFFSSYMMDMSRKVTEFHLFSHMTQSLFAGFVSLSEIICPLNIPV